MKVSKPESPETRKLVQRIAIQESKLVQLQATVEAKDAQLANLQTQIRDLTERNTGLQKMVETLQIQRPRLAPEFVLSGFKSALDKLQESLRAREGALDYAVSRFDVQLKANVTLDESGSIRLQLPRVDEILPSENFSVINLSLRTVPRAYVPTPELIEVPNIVGMSKGDASNALTNRKLKLDKVIERTSVSPAGTVINQEPAAYSRAPAGTTLNIVIAKPERVKVPDLLKRNLDEAKEILTSSRLLLGELSEKASRQPAGSVLDQKPKAGCDVDPGSTVDLVISKS